MKELKTFDSTRLGMLAIAVFLLIIGIDEMSLFLNNDLWKNVYIPAGEIAAIAFVVSSVFTAYSFYCNRKFSVFAWFSVIFLCGILLFLTDLEFLRSFFPKPNFGRPIMCVGFGLAFFSLVFSYRCFKNKNTRSLFFVFFLLAIAFVLEAGAVDMFRDGEVKTVLDALYAHKSLHAVKGFAGMLVLLSGILVLFFNRKFRNDTDNTNVFSDMHFGIRFIISYCLAMIGLELILMYVDSKRFFVDYHYFAPTFFMILGLIFSLLFFIFVYLHKKKNECVFLVFAIAFFVLFAVPNYGILTVETFSINVFVSAGILFLSIAIAFLCSAIYAKIPSFKLYLMCILAMFVSLILFECGLLSGNANYTFFLISGIIIFATGILLVFFDIKQKTILQ